MLLLFPNLTSACGGGGYGIKSPYFNWTILTISLLLIGLTLKKSTKSWQAKALIIFIIIFVAFIIYALNLASNSMLCGSSSDEF